MWKTAEDRGSEQIRRTYSRNNKQMWAMTPHGGTCSDNDYQQFSVHVASVYVDSE